MEEATNMDDITSACVLKKVGGSGSPGKESSHNPEYNCVQRTQKSFRLIRLEKSHFRAIVRLSPLGKVKNSPFFPHKWTDSRMGTEGEKCFPL